MPFLFFGMDKHKYNTKKLKVYRKYTNWPHQPKTRKGWTKSSPALKWRSFTAKNQEGM